ncbi:MAG: Smr/MutS family protein, partial [Rhodobacterales bacterium]|nr:Smr/MutS family protein [Rhodobacterales bacterium]
DEFQRPINGVLRQSLPDWLSGPSVSDKVLQVTQAQPKHGGTGAFYVYLRRKR